MSKKKLFLTRLDTIRMKISCEDDVVHFDVFINNKKVEHTTCFLSFLLFSKFAKVQVNPSEYNRFDTGFKSFDKPYVYSDFEPFTCTCGHAGCAGIHDGIYSKHKKRTVSWKIKSKDQYNFLPKKYFNFNIEHYERELLKIWKFFLSNDEKYYMHSTIKELRNSYFMNKELEKNINYLRFLEKKYK